MIRLVNARGVLSTCANRNKEKSRERKKDTRVKKETLVRKLSRAGPLATYKGRSV